MQPATLQDASAVAPAPRLHPLLSCLIFVAMWLTMTAIVTSIPIGVWAVLHLDEMMAALRSQDPSTAVQRLLASHGELMMLGTALAAGPTFGLVALSRRKIDQQPWEGLRLSFNGRHLVWGLGVGAAAVLAIFAVLVLSGDLVVAGLVAEVPAGPIAILFGLVFLQSGAEELVCRGYLMRTLMARFPPAAAIALVSLFFGALHLMNPDVSALSTLETTLIGVLFSLVCLRTDGLWCAVGLHTAWNFTLGTVASLPVSGMALPHLFDVQAVGSAWMTGGTYGLEASLITLGMIVVGCVVVGLARPWRASAKAT